MNKLKRCIHKDRYGIVRSCVIMCALLLLCLFAFISLQGKQTIEFNKERSAHAAKHVSSTLEQVFRDGVSKLEGAAGMLERSEADESSLLPGLIKYGKFSDAAIQRADALHFADGRQASMGNLTSYASRTDTGAVVFFAHDRETVRMSMQINAGEQLVVWLDAARIDDVFASAFGKPYDYAVFNAETGGFLLNAAGFDDGNYYDALLHMNDDGSAESLLSQPNAQARFSTDESKYYFAQQQTGIAPWSIALIIPDDFFENGGEVGRNYILFACGILLVMIAVVLVNAMLALRRIRISNQNTVRAFATSDHMMQLCAQDSGTTVFMYNRVWDRILSCYDGLHLESREHKLESISSLADCCSLEASETDLIYDSIGKLVPGDTAEITLHINSVGQDVRELRCTMHALNDGSKNVICVLCDATQQQAFITRADIEKEFMQSVQRKASSIWQVNISRNRWQMISSRKDAPMQMESGVWKDYSEDLRGMVRESMHPADYSGQYEKNMDAEALADAFRMGKTEFTCEYRVFNRPSNAYEWHRMQVRLWLDVRTNDILANLYIFNVNAKKNAELERGERKRILQQAVTALGGMYFGLYYVDLENDLSYTARSLGGELVDQLCLPYKATFDEYIDTAVHPEDRENLRKLLSAYALRRNMTEGSHFQHGEYRRKVGDDGYAWSSIIVQPARFENGSVKEVVLAIRDIDKKNDAAKI